MESKYRVLTFGDGLITLNPREKGPLRFVNSFEPTVGGAELNFSIGISRLGLQCEWVSKLGNDEFGKKIYNFVRGEGVGVSHVSLMNTYRTPLNIKQVNNDGGGQTFYYRDNSPLQTLSEKDINHELFQGIDLLFISGVFLAVLKNKKDIIEKIFYLAMKNKVEIAFDPNIRLKLWTIEEARELFEKIYPYVDIFLTGLEEIRWLEDIDTERDMRKFAEKYNIKQLVIKDAHNGSKLLYNNNWYRKDAFKISSVDSVGAGDGFNAGFIYAHSQKMKPLELLNVANAVGAKVCLVRGDNEGLPYLDELDTFIKGHKVVER